MTQMLPLTIMQLSDLHRDGSIFQSPNAFVSSIVADVARFPKQHISKPNLLLVCGDIIQGSNNSSFDDAVKEIKDQYIEAANILDQLCSKVFEGNKDRIIIIPGNHDISWPYSRKSMQRMRRNWRLVELLKHPESRIRWNWADFSFYQIIDSDLYEQRLGQFAKFFNDFYGGKRTYPLKSNDQFSVFEFADYKTLIVGFNSCFMNDHLNFIGKINPDCISKVYDYISVKKFSGWRKISLWHHDIYGVPSRSDFMDERTVQFLIDKGFHIGLHGHLHRTEVCEIKFSADQKVKVPLFGCGSLSAPAHEIPTGLSNQYSIIQINEKTDNIKCFLRKAVGQPPELPIWMSGNFTQNNNKGYITIKIEKSKKQEDLTAPMNPLTVELFEIQDMVAKREFKMASEKLKVLDQNEPLVRRLTVECLWQLDMDNDLISYIQKPSSLTEFAYLAEALWRSDQVKNLSTLLAQEQNNKEISSSEIYLRMAKQLSDRGL